MVVMQPVPMAHEPPVVARMAAELGATQPQSGKTLAIKVGVVAGLFGLLWLSYRGCVNRGACGAQRFRP